MAIELVTGVPGAGKTLLTVWRRLRPLVGTSIEHEDANGQKVQVPVRLMVGGIPQLLLDHEPITVPYIRWENGGGYEDKWSGITREPGEPPHQVEHRVDNWWLWCQPGDYIVVDEAWQCFGSFPAGRKVPDFYTMLARHRHYGVNFILIGQAPTQFHTFVRGLVNKHEFIRRMFGSSRLVVYEWDHCASHTSVKTATKSLAKHDKRAFDLYRSSVLHIKPKAKIPVTVLMLLVALVVLPFLWYRVFKHAKPDAPSQVAPSASAAPAPWAAAPGASVPGGYALPQGRPAFAEAVIPRHTWPDQIAGCWADDTGCHCMTQEKAPRVISDRPAMCAAVVSGDLEPPASHIRQVSTKQPERSLQDAGPGQAATAAPGAASSAV